MTTEPSDREASGTRGAAPGRLVAVLGAMSVIDFVARVKALEVEYPGCTVSNGPDCYLVRSAGCLCRCSTCRAQDRDDYSVLTDGRPPFLGTPVPQPNLCRHCGDVDCPASFNCSAPCAPPVTEILT